MAAITRVNLRIVLKPNQAASDRLLCWWYALGLHVRPSPFFSMPSASGVQSAWSVSTSKPRRRKTEDQREKGTGGVKVRWHYSAKRGQAELKSDGTKFFPGPAASSAGVILSD